MKTHDKIILYGLLPYDRSAKVRWLLNEVQVPYTDHWLKREELSSPSYLKINPMGRVPAVEINGKSFAESGAILNFLADRYGLAPKAEAPERIKYEQWMYFAVATLDVIQTRIMIIEDIPEGKVRTDKENALLSDLRDTLETLNHTLETSDFLAGSQFTAADIGICYHLYFLRMWPELDVVIKDYPKVVSYLERLKSRPAAVESKAFSFEG